MSIINFPSSFREARRSLSRMTRPETRRGHLRSSLWNQIGQVAVPWNALDPIFHLELQQFRHEKMAGFEPVSELLCPLHSAASECTDLPGLKERPQPGASGSALTWQLCPPSFRAAPKKFMSTEGSRPRAASVIFDLFTRCSLTL